MTQILAIEERQVPLLGSCRSAVVQETIADLSVEKVQYLNTCDLHGDFSRPGTYSIEEPLMLKATDPRRLQCVIQPHMFRRLYRRDNYRNTLYRLRIQYGTMWQLQIGVPVNDMRCG